MNHYTAHQARDFAWELSRKRASSEQDRLSQSLFDAHVDVNPHQIEATKTQLEQAKAKLESQQAAQLASLIKHDLTGTMLQARLKVTLRSMMHNTRLLKATVIQDVKNAVAAGKIVTISQAMISYKGWTGTGYILLDPNTGAGAYLIGGGQDGAWMYTQLQESIMLAHEFIGMYGADAWYEIRKYRDLYQMEHGYNETIRNAEHYVHQYVQVCYGSNLEAHEALLRHPTVAQIEVIGYEIFKSWVYLYNSQTGNSLDIGGAKFNFLVSYPTISEYMAGDLGVFAGKYCLFS